MRMKLNVLNGVSLPTLPTLQSDGPRRQPHSLPEQHAALVLVPRTSCTSDDSFCFERDRDADRLV